jgi:uncharacterized membrane protein
MRKLAVAIFPDEKTACDGDRAVKELAERGLVIYAAAVVLKDISGKIAVLDRWDSGSHTTAVAALIGGLAGLPAGPVGAAMGAAGGGLIGFSAELTDRGVEARFLNKMSHELAPNKAAIVVDLDDNGLSSFDQAVKELGGALISQE